MMINGILLNWPPSLRTPTLLRAGWSFIRSLSPHPLSNSSAFLCSDTDFDFAICDGKIRYVKFGSHSPTTPTSARSAISPTRPTTATGVVGPGGTGAVSGNGLKLSQTPSDRSPQSVGSMLNEMDVAQLPISLTVYKQKVRGENRHGRYRNRLTGLMTCRMIPNQLYDIRKLPWTTSLHIYPGLIRAGIFVLLLHLACTANITLSY